MNPYRAIEAARTKWPQIDAETVKIYAVPLVKTAYGDYRTTSTVAYAEDEVPKDWQKVPGTKIHIVEEVIAIEQIGDEFVGFSPRANVLFVGVLPLD